MYERISSYHSICMYPYLYQLLVNDFNEQYVCYENTDLEARGVDNKGGWSHGTYIRWYITT